MNVVFFFICGDDFRFVYVRSFDGVRDGLRIAREKFIDVCFELFEKWFIVNEIVFYYFCDFVCEFLIGKCF